MKNKAFKRYIASLDHGIGCLSIYSLVLSNGEVSPQIFREYLGEDWSFKDLKELAAQTEIVHLKILEEVKNDSQP